MPIYANIGGAQKQLSAVYANIGGAQKQLSSMLGNVGGASKELMAQPIRVLLTTITISGTFTPSSFPSIGNKYDIIAVGGGGGGGAGARGGTQCGGGGASGDTIAVNNLTISSNVSVTIGAGGQGGSGTSTTPGKTGYETVFGSYVTARGGDYGRGGVPAGSHGSGGTWSANASYPQATGNSGQNGRYATSTYYGGNGGDSQYGTGGTGGTKKSSTQTAGTTGTIGAGGGGGSTNTTDVSVLRGYAGGDGLVYVYGYVLQ